MRILGYLEAKGELEGSVVARESARRLALFDHYLHKYPRVAHRLLPAGAAHPDPAFACVAGFRPAACSFWETLSFHDDGCKTAWQPSTAQICRMLVLSGAIPLQPLAMRTT